MEQQHKQRQSSKSDVAEVDESVSTGLETTVDEEGLDELLAEIDEVLEENAEEFVNSYVQKGGE
jgi:prokaryotic ubiquitin-like protein Pup